MFSFDQVHFSEGNPFAIVDGQTRRIIVWSCTRPGQQWVANFSFTLNGQRYCALMTKDGIKILAGTCLSVEEFTEKAKKHFVLEVPPAARAANAAV